MFFNKNKIFKIKVNYKLLVTALLCFCKKDVIALMSLITKQERIMDQINLQLKNKSRSQKLLKIFLTTQICVFLCIFFFLQENATMKKYI